MVELWDCGDEVEDLKKYLVDKWVLGSAGKS
jgi:hypothetical protein